MHGDVDVVDFRLSITQESDNPPGCFFILLIKIKN